MACAASRSLADDPGFVAFTPNALTLTENLDPVFCRFSLMPLYNQAIAHGIAPRSAVEPIIVLVCPRRSRNEKHVIRDDDTLKRVINYPTNCICVCISLWLFFFGNACLKFFRRLSPKHIITQTSVLFVCVFWKECVK